MAVGRADFFAGVVMLGDGIWSNEVVCSLLHGGRPSPAGQNEGNTERSRAGTERDRERQGETERECTLTA